MWRSLSPHVEIITEDRCNSYALQSTIYDDRPRYHQHCGALRVVYISSSKDLSGRPWAPARGHGDYVDVGRVAVRSCANKTRGNLHPSRRWFMSCGHNTLCYYCNFIIPLTEIESSTNRCIFTWDAQGCRPDRFQSLQPDSSSSVRWEITLNETDIIINLTAQS